MKKTILAGIILILSSINTMQAGGCWCWVRDDGFGRDGIDRSCVAKSTCELINKPSSLGSCYWETDIIKWCF